MEIFCEKCNKEAKNGLIEAKSPRGETLCLCCQKCYPSIKKMIDKFAIQFGARIKSGVYLCSPVNTPNVKSLEQLQGYI